jgi:N-acetylmuramoyl-L-alanine amidase
MKKRQEKNEYCKGERRRAVIAMLIALCALMLFATFTGCNSGSENGPTGNTVIITPENGNNGSPVTGYIHDASSDPAVTPDNGNASDPTQVPVTPIPVTQAPATQGSDDPNLPLKGLKICVDPGHQGASMSEKEPCAPWGPEANSSVNNTVMKAKATAGTTGVSTGKTEFAVNLEIALKLRDALESKGATVIMSRTDNDSRISNRDRAILANENGCDLTFNIHCNGAENHSISGIEIYVRGAGDNTEEYARRSKNEAALGQKLLDKLCAYTGANKRNVNKSDNYTGINWRDHATFIIECGFMSNPEEDVKLGSPEYQEKLAQAILAFVLEDYKG